MPNLKVPLNNFQFGEISPSLTSRTDTPLYNNAAEKVRNFWIRAEGGLKRRAGTEYIATLGNHSYPVMTITFDNTAQNVGGFEVGNWFRLKTADGTLYQFQMQAIGSNTQIRDPSPKTGENGRIIFFVNGTGSGSTSTDNTAENLSNRINGIGNNTGVSNYLSSSDKVSPFTATFSGSTVTITRNETSHDNLEVETSNSGAFQVTDFRVLRMSHRLEPFIFSDDEKYLICFSHETIRAYLIDNDTGKPLIDAEGASYGGDDALVTITGQTWLQNTLDRQYIPEITFAQQGDIMFIAHNTFMIRQLVRTSLTTFTVETFNFAESLNQNKIYQPYFSFQARDVVLGLFGNNSIGSNKPINTFRRTPDGPVSTETVFYFKCPPTPSTHDTLINQVVAGKVYAIVNPQSSSLADFQYIGAVDNTIGLVFQATRDGSSVSSSFYSSTTGQLALLGDHSVAPHLGTNIRIKNTRVTIEALDNCTQGQCNQNGFASRARVKTYETVESKLPVDSLTTDEGSSVITVTQALHGFDDGQIKVSNAGTVGGIPSSDINGFQVITVVDDNTYTFDTGGSNATSSAIGGGTPVIGDGNGVDTNDWAEQSYSPVYGYPAAITFHQNRLWFGGSLGQPDSIWASKSGDFFNFDVGDAEDNDAIDITTSVGEINQIRHLVSNRDLQVFTAGSELYVQAPTTKPITPSNAQIIKQTPFGSTFVKPQAFDGATLFLQNTGNALREFLFTDAEDAYTSVAVSSLAPHLIRNPTQQTIIKGTLDRSENYSFLVNEDGTIAVFYSVRGDKKAGWSLWDTNGMWHSLCSVRENLYAISIRNGRVALEMFNQSIPLDHARFFSLEDGSSSVLGGFSDMITFGIGGTGLVGSIARTYKTGNFHAVDGNNYLGVFNPNGTGSLGQPTLDLSSTKADLRKILLGDAFYTELKTLPIDAQLANGPLTGEPREVSRIIADFNNTLSANVKAPDESSTARDLTITSSTTYPNNAIPFTGRKEFRTLGYSENPRVIISQGQPMDLQINGLVVEVAY